MTPAHFRAGLQWVLGLACLPAGTKCLTCGITCDTRGVHVTKCTRAGAPARGHTVGKDEFAKISREAGKGVQREQSLQARPDLIPADLLISHLSPGRPTALDFIFWSRLPVGYNDVLDKAISDKNRYDKQACDAEGWNCAVEG